MSTPDYRLLRNEFGKLMHFGADGQQEEVVPVRSFPIDGADTHIALVNAAGHEKAWIERLDELPEAMRELVRQDLEAREFIPQIRSIISVSSYATPAVFQVDTDRGRTQLLLRSEQDIRRIPGGGLLIADGNGLTFLIRNASALDRISRRFLDRFL